MVLLIPETLSRSRRRASCSDQTGGYDRREAATPAKGAKKRSFMTRLGQSDSMDHRVDGSAAGDEQTQNDREQREGHGNSTGSSTRPSNRSSVT
jgi:hypothetical protein